MKKQFISIMLLLLVTFTTSYAQEDKEFSNYAKKQKLMMLKAYAKKDITGYVKILNEYISKYEKYNGKDKDWWKWMLNEEYYLLADLYALAGKKIEALDYLVKSEENDSTDLMQDKDLNNIKKEPRFLKLLKAKPNNGNSDYKPIRKTISEYVKVMEKIKKYYNNEQADSMNKLNSFTEHAMFTTESLKEMHTENGKMVSYKYLAKDIDSVDGKGVALFKINYEKTTNVLGFSLSKNNKTETFRFETSSVAIDKLLAKEL